MMMMMIMMIMIMMISLPNHLYVILVSPNQHFHRSQALRLFRVFYHILHRKYFIHTSLLKSRIFILSALLCIRLLTVNHLLEIGHPMTIYWQCVFVMDYALRCLIQHRMSIRNLLRGVVMLILTTVQQMDMNFILLLFKELIKEIKKDKSDDSIWIPFITKRI